MMKCLCTNKFGEKERKKKEKNQEKSRKCFKASRASFVLVSFAKWKMNGTRERNGPMGLFTFRLLFSFAWVLLGLLFEVLFGFRNWVFALKKKWSLIFLFSFWISIFSSTLFFLSFFFLLHKPTEKTKLKWLLNNFYWK